LEPERRSGPGHSCSRDGLSGTSPISDPSWTGINVGERFGVTPCLQRQTKAAFFCRHRVPGRGRRLMRQTDLPTKIYERSASMRNDSAGASFMSADHSWEIRFGSVFQVAFRPSPHPRIRWTSRPPTARHALSVPRARRSKSSKMPQQNVDRCHPPGETRVVVVRGQSRRRV